MNPLRFEIGASLTYFMALQTCAEMSTIAWRITSTPEKGLTAEIFDNQCDLHVIRMQFGELAAKKAEERGPWDEDFSSYRNCGTLQLQTVAAWIPLRTQGD